MMLLQRFTTGSCMFGGGLITVYAACNVVRYLSSPDNTIPPLFGPTPMAFSTAVLFLISGLCVFWLSWWAHYRNGVIGVQVVEPLTSAQKTQITLALITSITAVVLALAGMAK